MASELRRLCILVMLLGQLPLSACGPAKGEFGFKTWKDDIYRKKQDPLEFSVTDEIRWVYRFPLNVAAMPVGVIYMKKEIVWVDMETYAVKVDGMNRHVYGTIKDFPVGEYKIVLVEPGEENRLIDEKYFSIYSDEDPELQ